MEWELFGFELSVFESVSSLGTFRGFLGTFRGHNTRTITQEISGIELTLSEVITRTDDLQLAA